MPPFTLTYFPPNYTSFASPISLLPFLLPYHFGLASLHAKFYASTLISPSNFKFRSCEVLLSSRQYLLIETRVCSSPSKLIYIRYLLCTGRYQVDTDTQQVHASTYIQVGIYSIQQEYVSRCIYTNYVQFTSTSIERISSDANTEIKANQLERGMVVSNSVKKYRICSKYLQYLYSPKSKSANLRMSRRLSNTYSKESYPTNHRSSASQSSFCSPGQASCRTRR